MSQCSCRRRIRLLRDVGWLALYKGRQDDSSQGNVRYFQSAVSHTGGAPLSEILIDIQYIGEVIHDVTSSECGRDAPH
jgi:hypothetical protein